MKKLIVAGTATALAAGALAGPSFSASTRTVSVKDNFFAPKSITVRKGTKVRWVWKGSAPHNVHGTGPATFKSSVRTSGSFSKKLTKKGTYKVVCDLHAGMAMKVKVR